RQPPPPSSMYYPQYHYLYSVADDDAADAAVAAATVSNGYERHSATPHHPPFHQAAPPHPHQHHHQYGPTAHNNGVANGNHNAGGGGGGGGVDPNVWMESHRGMFYTRDTASVASQEFQHHHHHQHPGAPPHDVPPHQPNGDVHSQTSQQQQQHQQQQQQHQQQQQVNYDAMRQLPVSNLSNGYAALSDGAESAAINSDQLNGYKVHYRRTKEGGGGGGGDVSPRKQDDFVRIGGPSEQKELAQLQILYKARGRKMDELTGQLSDLREETAAEMEILRQKISESEKEREGAVASLTVCQDLLKQSKVEVSQLKGQLTTADGLVQALTKGKEEVVGKLMSAECAIESLTHQVKELSKCDTLERARVQHESIVEGLQRRHQKELNVLKSQVDSLAGQKKVCEEDISTLKRQLADALKNAENSQISRAETINRLSRTLEESQRQCQHLLQASAQSNSTSQQLTDFQNRLHEAELAKRAAEEKFAESQQELQSLRYQLSMFDSASKLGVFASNSKEAEKTNSNLENSFQELAIKKKLVFSTPESSVVASEDSGNESQIRGLKHELERCLLNNREKQAYIEKLKDESKTLRKELADLQSKCSESEEIIATLRQETAKFGKNSALDSSSNNNNNNSSNNNNNSSNNSNHNSNNSNHNSTNSNHNLLLKNIESLKEEMLECKKDNEDYKERLRLAKVMEDELKASRESLEAELGAVLERCNAEKVAALEQCKRTYETFQGDVKERLALDLEARYDAARALVVSECEQKVSRLKNGLEAALAREDDLKEIYVAV
ncbi:centrosomal protein of 152 kDa-like, partial [Argonauta hians]